MKKLLFLLALLTFSNSFSQTMTEKWNSLLNRYEYYNSNNQLVGYKKYNNLNNTWVYYDTSQQSKSNYEYVQPVNLELANRALAAKQTAYDSNTSKVDIAITDIINQIKTLNVDEATRQNIIDDFASIVNQLNLMKYNYSSNTSTRNAINWLYSSTNLVIKNHMEKAGKY